MKPHTVQSLMVCLAMCTQATFSNDRVGLTHLKGGTCAARQETQDLPGARPQPRFPTSEARRYTSLARELGCWTASTPRKVFNRGRAIVLCHFLQTGEHRRLRFAPWPRPACYREQILAVCNSYNDTAASSQLPGLEIWHWRGVSRLRTNVFGPTENRVIMISKALNLFRCLSGCAKSSPNHALEPEEANLPAITSLTPWRRLRRRARTNSW